MRVVRGLDVLGNALILQLLFFLFSIPIVTAAPAAVALQREWDDFLAGRKTTVRSYLNAFRVAWKTSWPLGILFPIVLVLYVVALEFWRSAEGWIGALGFGLLLGLGFVGGAYYLALLVVSSRLHGERWLAWFAPALGEVLQRSPRYILGIVPLIAWFAVLWFSLPLLLVGSGIVPAAIAHAAGSRWPAREPEGEALR